MNKDDEYTNRLIVPIKKDFSADFNRDRLIRVFINFKGEVVRSFNVVAAFAGVVY